jgi:GntR family transcriptional repressor for pyruvate dehydrogenase complex
MPETVAPRSGDRVTEVVQLLQRQIETGELPPGARLPSERRISEQMSVSRSVVREALNRLKTQGLVRIRHGSGAVVEDANSRPVAESLERLLRRTAGGPPALIEVRLCLETEIAGLAAERRTDEHLRRLEEANAALAVAGQGLEETVAADLAFHMELARAGGNAIFLAVLEPIQSLLLLSRRRTISGFGIEPALVGHRAILAAVRERDAAAARSAMAEHLRQSAGHLASLPATDGPQP